jgi:hypothetical protein
MTLQQLQKEAEERFDKEFNNNSNSSYWFTKKENDILKSFLSSEIKIACEKMLEEVLPDKQTEEDALGLLNGHFGFNSCIDQIKENAKKLGL